MIDFDSIRQAPLSQDPFQWAIIKSAFTSNRVARELAESFPTVDFAPFRYSHDQESHSMLRRVFIERGTDAPNLETPGISGFWLRLCGELGSPEHRDAITRLTGVDVKMAPMEVSFRCYENNSWLAPHCDLPDKLVSQLFYFNDVWNCGWGGCLRILRSAEINDIHCELPPRLGSSVVLVRSESSWHAVPQVRAQQRLVRKSLQISFYRN